MSVYLRSESRGSGVIMWPTAQAVGTSRLAAREPRKWRQKIFDVRSRSVAPFRGWDHAPAFLPRLSPWATFCRPCGP
jgi:hypothetical protein